MTESMPENLLFVVSEELSDGSIAFNVKFGSFTFPAVDKAEAIELAERIAEAINDHTTQNAAVINEVGEDDDENEEAA